MRQSSIGAIGDVVGGVEAKKDAPNAVVCRPITILFAVPGKVCAITTQTPENTKKMIEANILYKCKDFIVVTI